MWCTACDKPNHQNCISSHGIRLFAIEVGAAVRKMQTKLFSELFSNGKIYSLLSVENMFCNQLQNLKDDPKN